MRKIGEKSIEKVTWRFKKFTITRGGEYYIK